MSQFSISKLVGSRAVIAGTDQFGTTNQIVVDTTQWDEVNATKAFDQATEAFEAAVEEFFRPLTEAAEAAGKAIESKPDAATYVVLKEAVEPVAGEKGQLIKLNHDSVLLRLVEAGNFDRLMWVGDELEVLAEAPQVHTPGTSPSDVAAAQAEIQAPGSYEG